MIKTIFFVVSVVFFIQVDAQQVNHNRNHQVIFNLKITDIDNPDSVAVMWFLQPYIDGVTVDHVVMFPHNLNDKGLYQQSISFPDSVIGRTIAYRYLAANGKTDFWRQFVLEKTDDQQRIEKWGFVDGLEGKIRPTKMLFPTPDSPAENDLLENPYVGITTDGKALDNLFPIIKTGVSTTPIKNAVVTFIQTLTEEQKTKSIFSIESKEWRRWHNKESWPRAGLCLEEMNSRQKELVFNLLAESLSSRGLQKVKDIMSMEAYLAVLVPEVKALGREKYWFTFYGSPSDTEPYGWQIEGHHIVINYFVLGDQVVMTPIFMGSEPNYNESGENEGLRTFVVEEKKGLDFYKSLTKKQKAEATILHKKEYDFNRSEAFRDNEIIPISGISARKLSKKQQKALLELIAEYVNNLREGQAIIKMEEVQHYLKETNFSWVQGDNPDGPFYYRIHSPVILIEFDHQTPVFIYDPSNPYPGPVKSHIHTVVRTPNGNDYGKDLLREHLEKEHKKDNY